MKKIVILFISALCLAGCQKNSIAQSIAESNPIMPIRMQADTTHVVLTDYVPALFGNPEVWKGLQWTAGESIECLNLTGVAPLVQEMDIVNRDRSIHAIIMHDRKGSFAIPVLPAKPVRQGLVSLGYADGRLRVGFVEPAANPSFEAYVQNALIDHRLWQEEEDGTWMLDITGLGNQPP